MSDTMATPDLVDSEFVPMALTDTGLRRMEAFGKSMLKQNDLPGSVWVTLDRCEAVKDADFVVVMIQRE